MRRKRRRKEAPPEKVTSSQAAAATLRPLFFAAWRMATVAEKPRLTLIADRRRQLICECATLPPYSQ